MAIQHRRGIYNRFDPTRLVAGEWAIVVSGDTSASDGMAAYICFAAGVVKRVATYEDMAENIANANQELIDELVEQLTGQVSIATIRANTAAQTCEDGEEIRVANEATRVSNESARTSAENIRIANENQRIANERDRVSAETLRASAEQSRASAETQRASAEQSRASAESTRVANETTRVSAESTRISNEAERVDNETDRVAAEEERIENETGRVTAEAARVAAFALIEQKIATRFRYTCGEGEYDVGTREPIIAEPDPLTRYFVPSAHPTAEDQWLEWEWDTEGERWEKIGTTEATFNPITTEQIDRIFNGTSVSGNEVLNTTDLSYMYALLVAGFAASGHGHSVGDITSGVFGVGRGGTGNASHTANSVLVGNDSSAVKNIASASGAFFATGSNAQPQFGTLPIAQGGTGATSAKAARQSLGIHADLTWGDLKETLTWGQLRDG